MYISSYGSSELDNALEITTKAFDTLKEEIEKLKEAQSGSNNGVMDIEYVKYQPEHSSWSSYAPRGFYYGEDKMTQGRLESAYESAKKDLAEKYQLAKATHEKNKAAIENNRKIHKWVRSVMEAIGVSDSYITYEYPSKRHKSKQKKHNSAGYLKDLQRCVKINDGWEEGSIYGIEHKYKKNLENLEDWYNQEKRKLEQEAKKKEAEKIEAKNKKVLALLYAKYDLPLTSSPDTLLEEILSKDKHLASAHYMEMMRNEGLGWLKTALQNIPEDSPCYEVAWNDYNNDNIDDHRYFRDMEYGYGYMYGKSNESLLKDYQQLIEVSGKELFDYL